MNFSIDITHACDQQCRWCNRLCGSEYARPANPMTLDQVQHAVSIMRPRITADTRIRIAGGEPTLHSQLREILDIIISGTEDLRRIPIHLSTHGISIHAKTVVQQLQAIFPPEQLVFRISKATPERYEMIEGAHFPLFRASLDLLPRARYAESLHDEILQCTNRTDCGIGITAYGVFACPTAAVFAHLLHKDIGLTHVPTEDELVRLQGRELCSYCGMIPYQNIVEYYDLDDSITVTPIWKRILDNYDPDYSLTIRL